MARVLLFCFATLCLVADTLAGAQGVGVNYGMLGNNLPAPSQVVALVKSRGITKLRLFDPNQHALTALHGSGIEVVLGTRNEDLRRLAGDAAFAASWAQTNVVAHKDGVTFRYITAGNEVIPGEMAADVLPAMRNLDSALTAAGLSIPVTTVVSTQVLGASFPPSSGAFSATAKPVMVEVAAFLASKNTPLLVNAYPYFAYTGDPANVPLDSALFTATTAAVQDGSLKYFNLFDAIVDAVYAALEDAGAGDVDIVVSETGWPSAGGTGATVGNAETYNNNVVAHVASKAGTPKKPGKATETYVFAMFNENQKPEGTEQNFGLYRPEDMTEVYHVNFP